jgi:hypothetical protein
MPLQNDLDTAAVSLLMVKIAQSDDKAVINKALRLISSAVSNTDLSTLIDRYIQTDMFTMDDYGTLAAHIFAYFTYTGAKAGITGLKGSSKGGEHRRGINNDKHEEWLNRAIRMKQLNPLHSIKSISLKIANEDGTSNAGIYKVLLKAQKNKKI